MAKGPFPITALLAVCFGGKEHLPRTHLKILVTRTTALTHHDGSGLARLLGIAPRPWGANSKAARHRPARLFKPALFAVPPIRAQKFRLDHVEDVCDRGIRR